jgi:hypothetical protein
MNLENILLERIWTQKATYIHDSTEMSGLGKSIEA